MIREPLIREVAGITRGRKGSLLHPVWLMVFCLVLPACMHSVSGTFVQEPADYAALDYYAWVQTAPTEDLESELRRLAPGAKASVTVVDDVQLALLLSHPPLGDTGSEKRARDMLDSIGDRPESPEIDTDYRVLARIWARMLEQRYQMRVLRVDLQGGQQQNDALEARIGELREQIQSLQKQIEALTSLEQQMIERERSEVP